MTGLARATRSGSVQPALADKAAHLIAEPEALSSEAATRNGSVQPGPADSFDSGAM